MKMRLRIAALILVQCSQCALAETLGDALDRAYGTNPDLTAARARLRAIDENVALAKAAGRIQLNGTSGLTQSYQDIGPFHDRGRALTATLGASYPIYAGGRVRNAVRAADRRVIAGRADLRAIEGDVLTEVAGAYLDVMRDAFIVHLNEQQVALLDTNFAASRERYRGGDLTRTDVAQSEARLADARSLLAASQGALTNSREAYRRIVGVWPAALDMPPPLPTLPPSPDDAVDIALATAPDLQSVGAAADAAAFDVRVAQASRLPVLSATAQAYYTDYLGSRDKSLGLSSNRGLDQVETSAIVGLTASLPIFQGGAPAAAVRQNRALENLVREQGVAVERGVVADVRAAYSNYAVATANIRSNEVAVSANQLALRGANEEHSSGTRTLLDVLNAQQELLNSQISLVVARRDQYVAGFTLLNAMGLIDIQRLGLDGGGALYDPLPNYRRASHSISDWNDGRRQPTVATRTTGATDLAAPATAVEFDSRSLPPTESATITRPSISPSTASTPAPRP